MVGKLTKDHIAPCVGIAVGGLAAGAIITGIIAYVIAKKKPGCINPKYTKEADKSGSTAGNFVLTSDGTAKLTEKEAQSIAAVLGGKAYALETDAKAQFWSAVPVTKDLAGSLFGSAK
jgi:hypothetical protein